MKLNLTQPLVISFLLGPNILLSSLFSNTLSLCSSVNVTDQICLTSHGQYRSKGFDPPLQTDLRILFNKVGPKHHVGCLSQPVSCSRMLQL